jgi:hypothetical protein
MLPIAVIGQGIQGGCSLATASMDQRCANRFASARSLRTRQGTASSYPGTLAQSHGQNSQPVDGYGERGKDESYSSCVSIQSRTPKQNPETESPSYCQQKPRGQKPVRKPAGSIGTTPTIASSDSSATEFQSKNGREHTLPTLVKSSSLNDINAHLLGQNQSFHGTQHL